MPTEGKKPRGGRATKLSTVEAITNWGEEKPYHEKGKGLSRQDPSGGRGGQKVFQYHEEIFYKGMEKKG